MCILSGCRPTVTPLAAAARLPRARFVDVAHAAGIRYRWMIPGKHPFNILQTIGNGCALLDYDNDGNLDILLVGDRLALYRGDGHGHFVDVTHITDLDVLRGRFEGCAIADYDNDGYEDIYLSGYRTGALLRNRHGVRFENVTKQSGIRLQPWGTSCAWGDIDNDGKLDLYVCNYVEFGPKAPQLCNYAGFVSVCGPRFYKPTFGSLYRNEGSGRFSDVTRRWGVDTAATKGLGAAFADFDGSGRQSLFVASDVTASLLLQNRGDGFEDIGQSAGIRALSYNLPYAGMGVDWGDYDNDSQLDLAVMAFQNQDKYIFHNEGNGLFTNRFGALGFGTAPIPDVAFGTKWLDLDNDGWLDLLMTNGHVSDNIQRGDPTATYRQATLLYRNIQGKRFVNESGGLMGRAGGPIVGRGLAIGDIDNDGRLDALVVDSEGAPLLLHNETPDTGHWLQIRLVGTRSNRDGIGSLVTVTAARCKQVRVCHTDGSYLSSSDRLVHIGLGAASHVDSMEIRWTDGRIDRFADIAADRRITVTEGSSPI